MMNKKAVELSVNFLVVIILAIVIVGLSFYILFTVFGEASELGELTQEQLNERVENLQCDGIVCMPLTSKILHRGQSHLFGMKILNTGAKNDFIVKVIPFDEPTLNYVPQTPYVINIDANQEEPVGIVVDVPKDASSGIYIFNIDVYVGDDIYAPRQQLRIEVP